MTTGRRRNRSGPSGRLLWGVVALSLCLAAVAAPARDDQHARDELLPHPHQPPPDHHQHGHQHHHSSMTPATAPTIPNTPTTTSTASTASTPTPEQTGAGGEYYFALKQHRAWLYLHILSMVLAWLVVMPISTVLSLASSPYHAPAQALFVAIHAVGAVFGATFHKLAPPLYPGNAHRKMGWALSSVLLLQAAVGFVATVARRRRRARHLEFAPVPAREQEQAGYRHSGDSGHGPSLEQEPSEHQHQPRHGAHHDDGDDDDDDDDGWDRDAEEKLLGGGQQQQQQRQRQRWVAAAGLALERFLSSHAPCVLGRRVLSACDVAYSAIARLLVPLAFAQICLGLVAGSGIFMGSSVFNGLAHFIKGGIFFLYGIVTLGRWLGAFGDLGWAWNVKPPPAAAADADATDAADAAGASSAAWSGRTTPTAEAVESGLIFVYGCANVFLEHLAGWGGSWSHSDLQHVSIAFMFFGGGLLGLLIESRWIRELLHSSLAPLDRSPPGQGHEHLGTTISFNPLPAMVVFTLGILMSQHHQRSHLSTVIHTQWGTLLAAAAVFRLLTYMLFFRTPTKPPSAVPSRPPTELVAAFCLMAGGLVFMISNRDTVAYLERVGVDAMFSLTVTVGMTSLVMCWVVAVMAVKGWAVRQQVAGVA